MGIGDSYTLPLPLMGGVIHAQVLHLPPEVIRGLKSYRHACRLAWKLRRTRITQQQLWELCDAQLYQSHISDYFSVRTLTRAGRYRRELPARHIAAVERVLGNTAISQYQAYQSRLTVTEELQAARRAA